MVKKTVTVSTNKKASPAASRAKAAKPPAAAAKKPAQRTKKVVQSDKVDYYPNRMTVAVSALAGTLLVLFALIAVLGTQ